MQTGDVIRDAQGRSYQVGPMLGRGLVGKTYLVRQEDSGAEYTLKCPLTREDFRGDTPAGPDLIAACRDTVLETGRLLEDELHPFLPPLHTRFTTPDGTPVLVLPRYTTTLEERLIHGCSLAEVLETLIQVCRHLLSLAASWGPHGNLRPGNVLLNDRGDVFLDDPATEAIRRSRIRLSAISRATNPYLPPEATEGPGVDPRASGIDTYAIGMMLYRALLTPRDGFKDGRPPPELPRRGLDKRDLVAIRARVEERLREEDSNPRFHGRLADRAAAFLNRCISVQTQPSPPYRFRQLDEVLERLEQLAALIRPEISAVGKLILSRPPSSDLFEAGEDIVFSVGVTPTSGVQEHEEISCGLAIFNEETQERLRQVPCSYTVERQPTGRFRFLFTVHDLPPARYLIRAAFAIRESGHPPATAEASLEVRAGPGYVPPDRPPAEDPGAAIPLDREDGPPTAVTEVGPAPVGGIAAGDTEAGDTAAGDTAAGDTAVEGPPPPEPSPLPPAVTLPAPPPEIPSPTEAPEPQLDPGIWMDLPPPGMVDPEELPDFLDTGPEATDPGDSPAGPISRFIDLLRGDSYLAIMTGFGLIILVLLIALNLLKG